MVLESQALVGFLNNMGVGMPLWQAEPQDKHIVSCVLAICVALYLDVVDFRVWY
jgi:hypothetical protein